MSSSTTDAQRPVYAAQARSHDDAPLKPSAKQVYALCHMTIDLLGLNWPRDRREASALIQRLSNATAPAQSEGMAF